MYIWEKYYFQFFLQLKKKNHNGLKIWCWGIKYVVFIVYFVVIIIIIIIIIIISVRTTIVKDDWQLAYSLDWRYGSVLGKNSLRIHAA